MGVSGGVPCENYREDGSINQDNVMYKANIYNAIHIEYHMRERFPVLCNEYISEFMLTVH